MTALGILIGLGLWIIGAPSPAALGLLAGLDEFIPLLGAILAIIPALLLAFSEGGNAVQYKTKHPVKRFLAKCCRYPKEFLQGVWLGNPKRIVESKFNALMSIAVKMVLPFVNPQIVDEKKRRYFLPPVATISN